MGSRYQNSKRLNDKRSETKEGIQRAENTNKQFNTGSTLLLISTVPWDLEVGRRVAALKKCKDRCADVTDHLFLWDHMISVPISKLNCGKNTVHINTRGKYEVDFK